MKIKYLLWATAAAALILFVACEEESTVPKSQAEWVAEGWQLYHQADFVGAEHAFGNAVKVDPYYAEAYSGQAWTILRLHDAEAAVDVFEDAVLLAQETATPLYMKQQIYMGTLQAYFTIGEYGDGAYYGRFMADNLSPSTFKFAGDSRVTGYDLYILLTMDYFALGDSANTVWGINLMRTEIGEQPTYTFQGWNAAATEIQRLANADPT
jgi:tetratricopeptide (TPR) repeat protein